MNLNSYNNYDNIRSLQLPTTCNTSMTRVFDYIKGKTIDESKLTNVAYNYTPPINSVGWYLSKADGVHLLSDAILFLDTRDATYDYGIAIYVHGGYSTLPDCCKNNPIKDCMCSTAQCILVAKEERANPINRVYDGIPYSVIDYAMSTLPVKGLSTGIIVLGLAGLILLGYLVTKKK